MPKEFAVSLQWSMRDKSVSATSSSDANRVGGKSSHGPGESLRHRFTLKDRLERIDDTRPARLIAKRELLAITNLAEAGTLP